MKMKMKKRIKIFAGILVSIIFIYLAFRKVQLSKMLEAIREADVFILLVTLAIILFCAWLRAVRWKYLLYPLKKIDTASLFNALMIGYATNFVLPAHLGEFARAYVIGKKKNAKTSSVFATIVTERVLDMLTLIILMIGAIAFYPFPDWVKNSSYIMSLMTIFIIVVLVALKIKNQKAENFLRCVLRPLPDKYQAKIMILFNSFIDGFVLLKNHHHYILTILLSLLIWFGYTLVFFSTLKAFGFNLPWIAPLVLMIITTISLVVPSSPGYIGTYHFLCQISLGLFGISKSAALGFAFVIHGLNTIPFLMLGVIFAWKEGMNIFRINKTQNINQKFF